MSPIPEHPTVTTLDGVPGIVESDPAQSVGGEFQVMVHFGNGQRYWVPAHDLLLQDDGSYRLEQPLSALANHAAGPTLQSRPAGFDPGGQATAPAMAEPAQPEPVLTVELEPPAANTAEAVKPPLATGAQVFPAREVPAQAADSGRVQVNRVVHTVSEVIDAPLMREEVSIHRVPVNEYVDAPPPIRYEDDRVIIPVVEEVLTVERRLLVKEEVVVTRRRTTAPAQQTAERRAEEVVAEPLGARADNRGPENTGRPPFREHFESHYASQGLTYEYLEPAYRYGHTLAEAEAFGGWRWSEVAPEARRSWESYNPGTWEHVAAAIEHGFRTTGRD